MTGYKSKKVKPCECGHNRWKTKQKASLMKMVSVYQCRKCDKLREVSRYEAMS